MPALDAAPSAAAALTPSSGSWMKGPAPFMRMQTNIELISQAAPCFGRRQMLVQANLPRHAAMEYGEVRSVVAMKPGVGDHAPERIADHELGQIRRKAAIDTWLERIYRTTFFDS